MEKARTELTTQRSIPNDSEKYTTKSEVDLKSTKTKFTTFLITFYLNVPRF